MRTRPTKNFKAGHDRRCRHLRTPGKAATGMRIALIGYGKMGHEIEAVAREQGETIARTFDIGNPVDAASLADVDVCIEFSTPQTVLENIRVALQAKKDIVVGTTGWYSALPEIRPLVTDSGLLY